MESQTFIQVRYQIETDCGQYHDALYFSIEEWDIIEQKEIDKEMEVRVNNWIDRVLNPPIPIEPTKEELLEQISNLADQKIELQKKLIENYEVSKEDLNILSDILDIQKEIIDSFSEITFPPTKEELQQQLDEVLENKIELETKISDFEKAINSDSQLDSLDIEEK